VVSAGPYANHLHLTPDRLKTYMFTYHAVDKNNTAK